MNTIVEDIIKSYDVKNIEETKARLREILQSIVLIGLSRSGFFKIASFYGGTALRIFYNLNRYSEDLDFTLNQKDNDFTLFPYLKEITNVASSYGLNLDVSIKEKKEKTPNESAFAKLNTYQTFISLKESPIHLHKDEVIKIKFEVDCNPSLGFNIENKWIDMPEFANVQVLDMPSLFAGKIHAILCRTYKNNVKGRDYYDYLFYLKKRIIPNMVYLKNKLIESNKIDENDLFDIDILKEMLIKRFEKIDFKKVKEDAAKFLFNKEDLSIYSKELFIDLTKRL